MIWQLLMAIIDEVKFEVLSPLDIFFFLLQGRYKELVQALKYFRDNAKMISNGFDNP